MRLLFIIFAVAAAVWSPERLAAQDPVLPTVETLKTVQSQFKTTLTEFPRNLAMAFVAAEDIEYFDNPVGRSSITLSTAALFSEQARPGMDVVGRLQHKELAVWLEQNTDHNGVLELYLNLAYFGRGAFGVEEASVTYFGKPAAQMRLDEAVYLALLPKDPTLLQLPENAEDVREKFDFVLDQLFELEEISEADHEMFLVGPLPVVLPVTE